MRRAWFVLWSVVPTLLAAQQATAPCAASDFHAFDFWVGEWQVTDTAGRVIATSTIAQRAAGCAITEHWQPLTGPDGVSVSWFDPGDRHWHQQWVGGGGWIASFTGDFRDGVMRMTSAGPSAQGSWSRMSWTALPDGQVRQVLETSTDGRTGWKTGFVGLYRRKE
jgi:hypothetical protein